MLFDGTARDDAAGLLALHTLRHGVGRRPDGPSGGDGTAVGGRGADAYRAFALRRLAAVPDLAIFHAGGPNAWKIDARHAEDTGGEVFVSIEGAVQPLPVIGVFAGAFADLNARGDAVLRVEVSFEGRPEWLEGDYDAWVEAWG